MNGISKPSSGSLLNYLFSSAKCSARSSFCVACRSRVRWDTTSIQTSIDTLMIPSSTTNKTSPGSVSSLSCGPFICLYWSPSASTRKITWNYFTLLSHSSSGPHITTSWCHCTEMTARSSRSRIGHGQSLVFSRSLLAAWSLVLRIPVELPLPPDSLILLCILASTSFTWFCSRTITRSKMKS